MLAVLLIILSVLTNGVYLESTECTTGNKVLQDGETWVDITDCKEYSCTDGQLSKSLTGCLHKGRCLEFNTPYVNKTTCKMAYCNRTSSSGYKLSSGPYGCIDNYNKCHEINDEWQTDNPCLNKTCVRISEGVIGEQTKPLGCTFDGTQCLQVGEHINTSLCIEYECRNNYDLHLSRQGCEVNGECKEVGSTWKNECIDYECKRDEKIIKPVALNGNCLFDGQCKVNGSTWMDGCFKYKCNDGVFKLIVGECKGKNKEMDTDKCYPVGKDWYEGDIQYSCLLEEDTYKKIVKNGITSGEKQAAPGCTTYNKERKNVDDTWDDKCFTKTCVKLNENTYGIKVTSGQCQHQNGTCIPADTTWTDSCFTYKCIKMSDTEYALKIIDAKCVWKADDKSICVAKDDTVNRNCVPFKCIITVKKSKYKAQMKRRKYKRFGCPVNGDKRLSESMKTGILEDYDSINDDCVKFGYAFEQECKIAKCKRNGKWTIKKNRKKKECRRKSKRRGQ